MLFIDAFRLPHGVRIDVALMQSVQVFTFGIDVGDLLNLLGSIFDVAIHLSGRQMGSSLRPCSDQLSAPVVGRVIIESHGLTFPVGVVGF
jgi:hypothetical protein